MRVENNIKIAITESRGVAADVSIRNAIVAIDVPRNSEPASPKYALALGKLNFRKPINAPIWIVDRMNIRFWSVNRETMLKKTKTSIEYDVATPSWLSKKFSAFVTNMIHDNVTKKFKYGFEDTSLFKLRKYALPDATNAAINCPPSFAAGLKFEISSYIPTKKTKMHGTAHI
jgi:hypothetical protein